MDIAYICCTLPGRDTSKLKNMWNKIDGEIEIYDETDIPLIYPTTTRYQLAYEQPRYHRDFDAFMFLGDDCELTPDFEKNMIQGLEDAIKIAGDRRVCVYPNDGIHGINLCTHPCFTKEWIDALGYFFPQGAMRHCFVDNYIMELGKRAGRIAYCESAKLIHHHHIKDKSIPMDEWQQKAYSKEFYEEDKRRYEYLLKTQLQDDINKLLR